jgi:hypothetical protein
LATLEIGFIPVRYGSAASLCQRYTDKRIRVLAISKRFPGWNLNGMSKIVSAAICILLLFLADRAAMHWKRIHGGGGADKPKADSIQLNETRRALGPQSVIPTNLMADDMVETGKL